MKVIIDVHSFRDSFAKALGATGKKTSPKPILRNVLFVADQRSMATLIATDLEIGLRVRVLGVGVETPGAVVLPGAKTSEILNTSAAGELSLVSDENRLSFRAPKANHTLTVEAAAEFPTFPEFPTETQLRVPAGSLREAIRRTVFATDPESTRYALGGVLWECAQDESFLLVATDGRRLARVEVPDTEGTLPTGTHILPAKALRMLLGLLNDDDPAVEIAIQTGKAGNHIMIRTDGAVMYSRLVEGRFPRYQDVIPQPSRAARFEATAGALLAACRSSGVTTSDESRGVDWSIAPGGLGMPGLLTMQSRATDVGEGSVELEIAFTGPAVTATFDHRYVAEFLAILPPENSVQVEIEGPRSPAVFQADATYKYIVMPLSSDR